MNISDMPTTARGKELEARALMEKARRDASNAVQLLDAAAIQRYEEEKRG